MIKHNVQGNIAGVRDAMLARLDALYSRELEEDEFLPRQSHNGHITFARRNMIIDSDVLRDKNHVVPLIEGRFEL